MKHCSFLNVVAVIDLQLSINIMLNVFTFNKIAIQGEGPDGKWTRKPLACRESNVFHLFVTSPPEICVNLVFKHVHPSSSYTICRKFVPLIYCPL